MTNQDILQCAMTQSAVDMNCQVEDFLKDEPVIVRSQETAGHRHYLTLPLFCNLVSYGSNIVASVSAEAEPFVKEYLIEKEPFRYFETPALLALDDAFRPFGQRLCFMAEYFLPDVPQLRERPCRYELRLIEPPNFEGLYVPEWSNALSPTRPQDDVLGVGAYDGGRLIGLAACSADCDDMWQIGVDILPSYRRQGIAAAMTSKLALAILERGKVPFYCAAWSNIQSVRNAISTGFRPAWTELTAKPTEFVMHMITNH